MIYDTTKLKEEAIRFAETVYVEHAIGFLNQFFNQETT